MKISRTQFKNPAGEYRPIPFWFWNGELEKEELDRQLSEMKNAGVLEFFIHARQGLLVPYLSEEWFDRVSFTVERAKQLGMKAWLYDEDNWPSGYAGGRVLEANPEHRAKHLARICIEIEGPSFVSRDVPDGIAVAVLASPINSNPLEAIDISQFVSEGRLNWQAPEGKWQVQFFLMRWTSWNPAYSQGFYTDLLDREAVESFIHYTHEEYRKRYPEELGKSIKGIFTDEPGFYNNLWGRDDNTVPWTTRFPQVFKEQKGYDLLPKLAALWEGKDPASARVRHDFYDVIAALFRDAFFLPIYEWCESVGMESIGHITIEEDLKYHPRMIGSFFRSMEYLHVPGIDEICQTDFDCITPKLGSSAAHSFGRERCFSETFGVYGWKLTLEEMKWVTDWHYARGINYYVPHAFYYSIRDERRKECPPSEFVQNTFWPYFSYYADYVGRMSYLLTRGTHVADIAVYLPVASTWAEILPNDSADVDALDASLKRLSNVLLASQRDFDYLDDDALARADVQNGALCQQGERYQIIVLPAARFIPVETLSVLHRFCESGGSLVATRVPEPLGDAEKDLIGLLFGGLQTGNARVIGKGSVTLISADDALLEALTTGVPDIVIEPGCSNINVLDRQMEDGKLYFLASRDSEPKHFSAIFRAEGPVSLLDIETGEVFPIEAEPVGEGCQRISLSLPGYGSLCVAFGQIMEQDAPKRPNLAVRMAALAPEKRIAIDGEWVVAIPGADFPCLTALKSWTELGVPEYSGTISYHRSFDWSGDDTAWAIWLDLGDVRDIAEVWLNGENLGSRVWRPFGFDVTDLLRSGQNELEVRVTNTPANEFEGAALDSGLLGPVSLCILQPPPCYGKMN